MTFGSFIDAINENKAFGKPQCAISLLNASVKGGGSLTYVTDHERVNNWLKPSFNSNLHRLAFRKDEGYHEFDDKEFNMFIRTRLGDRAKIRDKFAKIDSVVADYSDEDLLLYIKYQFVKIVGIPPVAASFEEYRNGVTDSHLKRINDGLDRQKEVLGEIQNSQEAMLQAFNVKETLGEIAEGQQVHAERINFLAQKVDGLINLSVGESEAAPTNNYPLFVAAPCLFSPITTHSTDCRAVYRCGYNDSSTIVLKGRHGSGQFAVISNDYILTMHPLNSTTDIPRSLISMVLTVITDLADGFRKKKVGFTSGHDECARAESIHPELNGLLVSEGVHIENCPFELFNTCDVLIVGNPQKAFSDAEAGVLLRYIMSGGSVLFCGIGYYWAHSKDENGVSRKIEDYPINRIGSFLGFKIESDYIGRTIDYDEKNTKKQLYFTPLSLAKDIKGQPGDAEIELIRSSGIDNDPKTQAFLGARFDDGEGVPKNRDYALYWYKMAAFNSSDGGQVMLAMWYCDVNPFLYRVWLFIAAKSKNNAAFGRIGFMYYYGTHGIKARPDVGFAMIKRSVDRGYEMARFHLGMIYLDKKMPKEAVECFVNVCYSSKFDDTRAKSHYQLGLLLREGAGCAKDLHKAQAHLKMAANLKFVKAKAALEQLGAELNAVTLDDLLWGGEDVPAFTDDKLEGTRYYSLPENEKERLLKWLNYELDVRIGARVGDYLTEEQIIVYDKILAGDAGIIEAECERLNIAEVYEYRAAKAIAPIVDEFALKADILAAKWLSLYAPDNLILRRNEYNNLKSELVRGEIVADVSSPLGCSGFC